MHSVAVLKLQIGLFAFKCCSNIENFNVPRSVYSIRKGAFQKCYKLKINIPPHINQAYLF